MLDKKEIAEIFNMIVMDKKTEFSDSDITDKMYKDFNSFYSNFILTNKDFNYKKLTPGEKSDNFVEYVLQMAQKGGINLQEGIRRINSFNEFNMITKDCDVENAPPNILIYKKNDNTIGMWYPNFNYGIVYEDKMPPNKTIMKTDTKSKKPQEFIMIQSLPNVPMSMTEHCQSHIKLFLDSVNDGTWEQTDLDLLRKDIETELGEFINPENDLIDLIYDYADKAAADFYSSNKDRKAKYDEIINLSNKLHAKKENKNKTNESTLTNYSVGDVINIESVEDFNNKLPQGWYKAMDSKKLLNSLFKKGGKISIEITNDDANTMTGLDVDITIIGDNEAPYLNAINEIKEFFSFDEESLIFFESKIFESKEEEYDYVINIIGGMVGKDKKDKSYLLKGIFGVKKIDTDNYILKGKQGEFFVTDKKMRSGVAFDVVDRDRLTAKDFVKNKMYIIYQNGVATDAKYVGEKENLLLFEIDDTIKEIKADDLKGVNSEKSKKLKLKLNESDYKPIVAADITEGSQFQIASGSIFIIDRIIENDKYFGTAVETSLKDGKKGNYKNSLDDVVDFFNEEHAVKLAIDLDDSVIEQINKVKNWKQFLNESSNFFIIKKKDDDEYVSHNDDNTSRFGGYSITQNKNGAAKFSTKGDAIEIINRYNLELNLMSELEVVNFLNEEHAVKLGVDLDDSVIEQIYDRANALLTKKGDISMYDKDNNIIKFENPNSIIESAMLLNLMEDYGYTKYTTDDKYICFEKA